MKKSFEVLDHVDSELGELVLRRRRIAMLDDEIVHEVQLNGEFLMSSLFHAAEDALAHLGVEAHGGSCLDVVVGGLGLGYTAAAALACKQVASVTVVEYLAPVIGWHREGLLPLGKVLAEDERVRIVQGDFFAMAAGGTGFDPEKGGRKFDAVLLDIDHTPSHWLHARHGGFYSRDGVLAMAAHLRPGGVFAMWSDGGPEAGFLEVIGSVFAKVLAHEVRFPNPITGGESASSVYVGSGLAGGQSLRGAGLSTR
jgi:spermidine synthase